MFRFYENLLFFAVVLYTVYIITCIAQLIGILKITYRQINIGTMFIPFYYWIHRNL